MFIHNINPVFFSIGPVSVYYYGLVYALGFVFMYWYLYKLVKNGKFKLSTDQLDSLLIYLILGVIIGGRLGEFLFYQQQVLLTRPLEILFIWHGGMSFHGGIIGVVLALWIFCKRNKTHIYDILDTLVIPLSAILVFGRIANFINGELVGNITTLSWGVNFHGELDIAGKRVFRHPSQIYEAIKNLLTFGILLFIEQKQTIKKKFKRGYITWLFALLYGVGRTIADIWRDDGHWLFGVFSTGQILSIAMTIIALFFLIKYYWQPVLTRRPLTHSTQKVEHTTNKKKYKHKKPDHNKKVSK